MTIGESTKYNINGDVIIKWYTNNRNDGNTTTIITSFKYHDLTKYINASLPLSMIILKLTFYNNYHKKHCYFPVI